MEWIYFAVKSCQAWSKDLHDGLGVYKHYFIQEGGFIEAFWIALLSALVLAAIYYLVIGFASKKTSTLVVWIVMFVLSMCASFVITDINTGMGSNGKSGLSKTLEQQWKDVSEEGDNDYEDVYRNMKTDFRKGLVKVAPVRNLCITNVVVTAIFYYLFSIIFCLILPASNYAKNYPHKLK